MMNSLSSYGSLEVFRFFMSKGIPIDQHVMGNLATRGLHSVIRSIYNNVVPVISLSGKIGNNTVTRFFDTSKRELDYTTVIKGIAYGVFEIKQSFVVTRSTKMLLIDLNVDADILSYSGDSVTSQKESAIDCVIYNQLPPVDEGTIQTSARHSHIDLVNFLISKKAPIDADAMYNAILRGFTDLVIILYEYYPVINQYHIELAKLWNRHKILEYLKDKSVKETTVNPHQEFTLESFDYYQKSISRILYYVCSHGEVDVLKSYRGRFDIKISPFNEWNRGLVGVRSPPPPIHDHTDMFYVAVLFGQFEIVHYLETKKNFKGNSNYTACAARIGRMDMMQYLVKSGYKVCEKSMGYAIEKSRLNFVKYLLTIQAPIPENALDIAKQHNADEIYEYLRRLFS